MHVIYNNDTFVIIVVLSLAALRAVQVTTLNTTSNQVVNMMPFQFLSCLSWSEERYDIQSNNLDILLKETVSVSWQIMNEILLVIWGVKFAN